MTFSRTLAAALLAVCLASAARAETAAVAPSCYGAINQRGPEPNEALFVLIDDSVGFDDNITRRVTDMVVRWMRPGRHIEIITFAAHMSGHYAEVVLSGGAEILPDDDFIDDLKRSERGKFERCIREQLPFAKQSVSRTVQTALSKQDKGVSNSDLLVNLARASNHIAAVKVGKKTVLIVSDMLENSSISSFYAGGKVRGIDARAELVKAEKASVLANFDSADVFIFGLGYLSASGAAAKDGYLDPKRSQPLVQFWSDYVSRSRGKIREIGVPLMLGGLD